MMTLSYNFGLTTGSLMAYFMESILNPIENHPCDTNYTNIKFHSTLYNTTVYDISSTINTTFMDLTTSTSMSSTILDLFNNTTLDMG